MKIFYSVVKISDTFTTIRTSSSGYTALRRRSGFLRNFLLLARSLVLFDIFLLILYHMFHIVWWSQIVPNTKYDILVSKHVTNRAGFLKKIDSSHFFLLMFL